MWTLKPHSSEGIRCEEEFRLPINPKTKPVRSEWRSTVSGLLIRVRERGQWTVWPCRLTGSWTVMQPLVCQLWTNWSRSIHKRGSHCSVTVVLSRACACACVSATTLYGNGVLLPPPRRLCVPPVSGLRLSALKHFSISLPCHYFTWFPMSKLPLRNLLLFLSSWSENHMSSLYWFRAVLIIHFSRRHFLLNSTIASEWNSRSHILTLM